MSEAALRPQTSFLLRCYSRFLPGVDRSMNEARAVVNLIGNGVASIAIARRDNALDRVPEVIREQRGETAPLITAAAHSADAVTAQG